MRMGRPSKYDLIMTKDKIELVRYWVIKGHSEEEIANKLEIAYSTLKEWKEKHANFSAALKAERGSADDLVEGSLYKRALLGDTTACIFWLKNRRPKEWRDRHEEERKTEKLIIVKADLNESESK